MKIKCFMCQKLLKEKGGILFSPPTLTTNNIDSVYKYHFCRNCYGIIGDKIVELKRGLEK